MSTFRQFLHRLRILASRLTQVGVQINQARQGDQPVGVELFPLGSGVPGSYEPAVPDQEIRPPPSNKIGTADQQVCHCVPPSNSYSTLIRTDTPAAT